MAGVEDRERIKKPGETDLQWRLRIAQLDIDVRGADGPLITPETEGHGNYTETFIRHIETNTMAWTKRNQKSSPMDVLHSRGVITADQLHAAEQIEVANSLVSGDVAVRGASLEARVDNSGGNRDLLIEGLARVWAELTYSRWRRAIPEPKAMILEMITGTEAVSRVCRRFNMRWSAARNLLIGALDTWIGLNDKVVEDVDREDIEAAHKRINREKV